MKFLSLILLAAATTTSALVVSNESHHHAREAAVGQAGHGHLVNRHHSHLARSAAIQKRRQQRQKRCLERTNPDAVPSSLVIEKVQTSTTSTPPADTPAPAPPVVEPEVVPPVVETPENVTPPPPAPNPVTPPPPPPPPPAPPAGGDDRFGQATFYDPGLGACGFFNGPGDLIVAVSRQLYDGFEGYTGANPNNNPICGRRILATANGKSIEVTVVDRCEACAPGDLDFTTTGFSHFADLGVGRLNGLSWHFI